MVELDYELLVIMDDACTLTSQAGSSPVVIRISGQPLELGGVLAPC